jgi:hypothetical protein
MSLVIVSDFNLLILNGKYFVVHVKQFSLNISQATLGTLYCFVYANLIQKKE